MQLDTLAAKSALSSQIDIDSVASSNKISISNSQLPGLEVEVLGGNRCTGFGPARRSATMKCSRSKGCLTGKFSLLKVFTCASQVPLAGGTFGPKAFALQALRSLFVIAASL